VRARRHRQIAKAWWIVSAVLPACALAFLLGLYWPLNSTAVGERDAFPMMRYSSPNEGEFAVGFGIEPIGDRLILEDDQPVELVERWVVDSAMLRLDQQEAAPLAELPAQRVRVHQQWW
jgi:hypothetical protein